MMSVSLPTLILDVTPAQRAFQAFRRVASALAFTPASLNLVDAMKSVFPW